MDYNKIYTALITKRQEEPFEEGYSELHHIIPQSLGGNDNNENLVRLSAREHYIAHALLVKIHEYDENSQIKMLWAFNGMNNLKGGNQQRIIGNSYLYASLKGKYKHSEKTKKKMSESAKGHTVTKETREKLSQIRKRLHKEGKLPDTAGENNPMYGKKLTTEHKEKMSKALKGKKLNLTEEEKRRRSERFKGENNPMFGKKMSSEHKQKIVNGNKNKVYTDVMRERQSEISKDKIHINNGHSGKFVSMTEFEDRWKQKGWFLGMKPRKKKDV